MALTSWSASNYLERVAQVINTYPFLISVWLHRVTTGGSCAVYVGDNVQQRRGQVRIDGTTGAVQALTFDGTVINDANTAVGQGTGSWYHGFGEFTAANSVAALINAGNKATNANNPTVGNSDRVRIGVLPDASQPFGNTNGIAEIALWDGTGMTAGNMDSLATKLFNGGVAGAGGNPLLITAEGGQPWSGKLRAYWPLANTTDLADASGNGHTLSMVGTLTNFASHPTIEPTALSPYHKVGYRAF
jgi:hypothetical protein